MKRLAVWTTVLLATAMSAGAQAQSDAPKPKKREELPYMRDPDWLRKPSENDMFSAWPKGVKDSGSARITCIVTVQGTLRACEATDEKPAGSGYGKAALAMAPQFLIKPATDEGKAIEARVTIPINFDCEDACDLVPRSAKVFRGIAWANAPTFQDMIDTYPERARKEHIGGVASLKCMISNTDGIGRCSVVSEQPRGKGFGSAAQQLAKKFSQPINLAPGLKISRQLTLFTFTFTENMLGGDASIIGKPSWAKTPSNDEYLAAFPKAALDQHITKGTAVVRCAVIAGGVLTDCTTVSEDPAGRGFGEAVVSLMPKFNMVTWTDEGLPVVGGVVLIPLTFDLAERPDAAKPAP